MKREKHILCIYLPQWSIDIVRRKQRVQQPILLFDKKRAEQIVVRCCKVSAKKGVYPGMSITHARALVSGAHLQAFEAGPEISALNSLGRWASRFSPLVQIESPSASKEKLYGNSELYYGISIDITASVKLFGGLSSLLRTMQSALNRFGIHHQLAVAPTLGAAWALARFSQQQVVGLSPQEINEVVGNLPLAALRLSPTISNSLKEIGVKNVAEVIKLPPKQLNSRFGLELVNRINQLTGKLNEPINAIKTKHTPQVSISFLSPVSDINNLLLATKKAFVELVDSIQASGEAARCFTVSYKRYRAPDISKDLSLHFP